ncbi:MAG: hypothetical protein COB53_12710 [Elusimicrobia bacterium]|nr:MAG: hypothetical protein COB53_12710 [Elusimicrobiota bacterium]
MTPADAYEVLELPNGTSRSEVKQAYRNLALIWHPDLYPYDEVLRQQCEEKMTVINAAYDILRHQAPETEEAKPAPEPTPEPASVWEEEEEVAAEPPEWDGQIRIRDPQAEKPPPRAPWRPFRRNVRHDAPDYGGLRATLFGFGLSAAVMLSLFVIDNPTSLNYYMVLRTVVPLASLYGTYFALDRGYWESAAALLLLALSLNPIFPLPMSIDEWRLFNIGCPVVLLFLWFHMYDRESSRG